MPSASITVNGTPGSNDDLPINTLVQLNNQNSGGEVSFKWSIVTQPEGTTDALSSTTIQNPTFTPKKEGTYLIQLIVNLALPSEVSHTVVCAVRQLKTRLRIPAPLETTQIGSTGWGFSVGRILQLVDTMRADHGIILFYASAPLTANDIVRVTGTQVIKSGLPGQENVPIASLANATSKATMAGCLACVLTDVSGGPVGAGDLFYARKIGLVPGVGLVGSVGDPVFLSDSGVMSLTEGTIRRQVGTLATATGDVYFDGKLTDFDFASTGVVGGDLGGNLPNPTVVGIQGSSVDATSPNTGELLEWDGTKYTPTRTFLEGLKVSTSKYLEGVSELNLKANGQYITQTIDATERVRTVDTSILVGHTVSPGPSYNTVIVKTPAIFGVNVSGNIRAGLSVDNSGLLSVGDNSLANDLHYDVNTTQSHVLRVNSNARLSVANELVRMLNCPSLPTGPAVCLGLDSTGTIEAPLYGYAHTAAAWYSLINTTPTGSLNIGQDTQGGKTALRANVDFEFYSGGTLALNWVNTSNRFALTKSTANQEIVATNSNLRVGTVGSSNLDFLTNNTSRWQINASTGVFSAQGGDKLISNVADPSGAQDAATKNYVDTGHTLKQTVFAEIATDTTTTSTTFTTLLTANITTVASTKLRIIFTVAVSNSSSNNDVTFRVLVDGTAKRGANNRCASAGNAVSGAIAYVMSGLSAGAHTVTVEWKTSANTAQIRPASGAIDREHASLLVEEVSV